jgi:hypothetical protein
LQAAILSFSAEYLCDDEQSARVLLSLANSIVIISPLISLPNAFLLWAAWVFLIFHANWRRALFRIVSFVEDCGCIRGRHYALKSKWETERRILFTCEGRSTRISGNNWSEYKQCTLKHQILLCIIYTCVDLNMPNWLVWTFFFNLNFQAAFGWWQYFDLYWTGLWFA